VRGDLPRAQDIFLRAIDERKKLVTLSTRYNEGLVACLSNMSTLMRKFNKNDVALVYLKDALAISESWEGGGIDTELAAHLRELVKQMEEKTEIWNTSLRDPSLGPN